MTDGALRRGSTLPCLHLHEPFLARAHDWTDIAVMVCRAPVSSARCIGYLMLPGQSSVAVQARFIRGSWAHCCPPGHRAAASSAGCSHCPERSGCAPGTCLPGCSWSSHQPGPPCRLARHSACETPAAPTQADCVLSCAAMHGLETMTDIQDGRAHMVTMSRARQQIGPSNTLILSCQAHQALDMTAASQCSQQSVAIHCTCSSRLPDALSQWGMLCWCPKDKASSAECQDWGCMSWSAQEPLLSGI